MNTTHEDPLVEEIRTVRRELADRFGDDVDALCDFLAEGERQHEERLVNRAPRSPHAVKVQR